MCVIMVDVESDGPISGDYSMIAFAAVIVNNSLDKIFYARLKPISEKWLPEAPKITGFTRKETFEFDEPKKVMMEFRDWIKTNSKTRPLFFSDNNGFDWQFINWYFIHFINENPFCHTSTNLGSLYKGMVKNMYKSFKYLRKTRHTHNPVDDAIGNAEALLYMKNEMGLKISLE